MQKNEVQIGSVRQLHTAQLAVRDDADTCCAQSTFRRITRNTMLAGEIGPGNIKCVVQYDFRQFGQSIADFHDRQIAAEIGHGNAKKRRSLKLAENFDLLFAVGNSGSVQPFLKIFTHAGRSNFR